LRRYFAMFCLIAAGPALAAPPGQAVDSVSPAPIEAPKAAPPPAKLTQPQPAQGGSAAEPVDPARTAPPDPVYRLDREGGAIRFGDGRHGRVPPTGKDNIVPQYRSGAGAQGAAPQTGLAPAKLPGPAVKPVPQPPAAADGGFAPRVPTAGGARVTHRELAGPSFVGTPLVRERLLDGPDFVGARLVTSKELSGPNFIGSRVDGR